MPINLDERQKIRLSDRIVNALDLAVEQEDIKVAEKLNQALELSMTRNTGGGDFIERREYPPEIEQVIERFEALRKKETAV